MSTSWHNRIGNRRLSPHPLPPIPACTPYRKLTRYLPLFVPAPSVASQPVLVVPLPPSVCSSEKEQKCKGMWKIAQHVMSSGYLKCHPLHDISPLSTICSQYGLPAGESCATHRPRHKCSFPYRGKWPNLHFSGILTLPTKAIHCREKWHTTTL